MVKDLLNFVLLSDADGHKGGYKVLETIRQRGKGKGYDLDRTLFGLSVPLAFSLADRVAIFGLKAVDPAQLELLALNATKAGQLVVCRHDTYPLYRKVYAANPKAKAPDTPVNLVFISPQAASSFKRNALDHNWQPTTIWTFGSVIPVDESQIVSVNAYGYHEKLLPAAVKELIARLKKQAAIDLKVASSKKGNDKSSGKKGSNEKQADTGSGK